MKNKILIVVALLTLYCTSLVIFRVLVSGNIFYVFMIWNLFLALIPFIITQIYYLIRTKNKKISKITTIIFFCVFLIFYPNINYLVTDIMHLPEGFRSFPVRYDNILLFSFSFLAIIISFFSLNFWQNIVYKTYSKIYSWVFVVFIIALSSYGIFLGRYIRLNSWEILSNPLGLLNSIYESFFMQKMYFFSLNFFFMSLVLYISLYLLFGIKKVKES